MMKRLFTSLFLSFVLLTFLPGRANAAGDVELSAANFPDANFRAAVASAFDTDNNGRLSSEELAEATSLQCINQSITSVTGVKLLPNLESLDCSNNNLTKLDVSGLANLTHLACSENQLTSLNLTGCNALQVVLTQNNRLTSLNLSGRANLEALWCTSNALTSLNVSNCPKVTLVACSSNQLTSLNLSGSTAIRTLFCNYNNLTSLNLSGRTNLIEVQCLQNKLTSLNVSGCTGMAGLYCHMNQLTSLNLGDCKELVSLYCCFNNLSVLDISGTNINFSANSSLGSQMNDRTITVKMTPAQKEVYDAEIDGHLNNVNVNAVTAFPSATVSITSQPASVTVTEGSTASFKVVASGTGLTYRWQYRASSSGTWTNCTSSTAGYNTATLKPVGTAARNGYQYRCIVKDSVNNSATSKAVTLTVKAGLAITAQPANTTVTEGSTAAFKVVATGAASYQWQWRDSAAGTWKDCSSATSGYNAATLKPVGTAARNGYQYRCVVKDASGKSVTSNAATLTVKAGLAITTQPASTTVTEGSTASFKVVATGASSYQWQWRENSTSTWKDCSSATSGYNTANLKPVGTAARNGYQYRCVVKDADGKSVTSNAATLTVKAGLAITTQPVSQTVALNESASFKVVATNAASYQWQWRENSTSTWKDCSSATSGYNTANLKPVGTAARNGYQYRCVVKDASGKSVTSNVATLTVKAALAITTQPASTTVTEGSTASFKVVATAAASYQWQWRAGSTGTWANCSSATTGYNTATLKPVGTTARNGYQYRCIVKDASGNSVTSGTATLTVKVPLAITVQPVSVTVAEGSTASFSVAATGAASYQWQWRAGSNGTWKDCSSVTAGYNTAALHPVATAARNGYQYRCVVTDASGASVISNAATLTI